MPRYRTPLVEVLCVTCGKPFFPKIQTAGRYCSRACVGLRSRGTVEERFWSKVDKSGECWLWTAGTFPSGYGLFWSNGTNHPASRFAWELTNGLIPDGLLVCHNCPGGDNPLCVNPSHLWLGTIRQNSEDMVAKGRSLAGDRNPSRTHPERLVRGDQHPARLHPELRQGELNGRAVLTEADVREIRRRFAAGGVLKQTLASEYRVSHGVIGKIIRRASWKHVA